MKTANVVFLAAAATCWGSALYVSTQYRNAQSENTPVQPAIIQTVDSTVSAHLPDRMLPYDFNRLRKDDPMKAAGELRRYAADFNAAAAALEDPAFNQARTDFAAAQAAAKQKAVDAVPAAAYSGGLAFGGLILLGLGLRGTKVGAYLASH